VTKQQRLSLVLGSLLLGATPALAADHVVGGVDMQFYPYSMEVDSHADWD